MNTDSDVLLLLGDSEQTTGQATEPATPVTPQAAPEPATPVTPQAAPAKTVTLQAAPLVSAPVKTAARPVIYAPPATGWTFVLKIDFNGLVQTGQMLVFANEKHRDSAIEVLECFLPKLEPGRTLGYDACRVYLGERKPPAGYKVLLMTLRATRQPDGSKLLEYQLLLSSSRAVTPWLPLDLATMPLRTTAAHRAMISEFAGVDYRAHDPSVVDAQKTILRRTLCDVKPKGGSACLGNMFDKASISPREVRSLSAKLEHEHEQAPQSKTDGPKKHKHKKHKKHHAAFRSDLQRGLRAEPVAPIDETAGKGVEPASTEPVVGTTQQSGFTTINDAAAGAIELAAKLVTTVGSGVVEATAEVVAQADTVSAAPPADPVPAQ